MEQDKESSWVKDLQEMEALFKQVIKQNERLAVDRMRMKAGLQRIMKIYKSDQQAYHIAASALERCYEQV